MSDYKPEVLPSGVMLRKIKSEDEGFILSNIDQALIVTNLDIAAMYGLAYPEIQPALKSSLASIIKEPINAVQAWHDVSQKLLESELKKKAESRNECIACTIQERDEQVKQMPRHTCDTNGPNPGLDELKSEYKADPNAVYNAEVRRIAEILANIGSRKLIKEAKAALRNDLVEKLISGWDECARAMMAETVKELSVWMDNYAWTLEGKREYLIKRGLIPASAQEGGENG